MTAPPARPSADLVGRLFLAVPLEAATRAGLAAYIKQATHGRSLPGRTVPPENWHLTLRFLGDTSRSEHTALTAALGAADLGPAFDLAFNGLGAFPKPDRARVLWVGVDVGREPLVALAAVVEGCAIRAGFPPEDRPFGAHLTLSRLQPPEDVRRLVNVSPGSDVGQRADRVVLYRSHLGRGPAQYEELATYGLR